MKYVFERTSEPGLEPIELARMKRELGEFSDVIDRDDDITAQIVAGREWVEDYTGRALVDQTWRLNISHGGIASGDDVGGYSVQRGYYAGPFFWSSRIGEIFLRRSPVLAITSFRSVDADGVETTIDASTYEVRDGDSKFPRLVAKSGATWTNAQDLRIEFRAGYADRTGSPIQDATVIPERFKQAIILYAKALYNEQPELIKTAEKLIRSQRVHMGFA